MSTDTDNPVQIVAPGRVRIRCRKCDAPVILDFGDMTREQALETIARIDKVPQECPGYHFELSGWKENQVVVRFWIITIMLVLVGLSTLKIR